MGNLEIVECLRSDMHSFSKIICQAFHDKYSKFFSGMTEEDYTELIILLYLADFDHNGNTGKFLLKFNEIDVGAIEYYTKPQHIPFKSILEILLSKMNLIMTIKTSLMLIGFGPPFKLRLKHYTLIKLESKKVIKERVSEKN